MSGRDFSNMWGGTRFPPLEIELLRVQALAAQRKRGTQKTCPSNEVECRRWRSPTRRDEDWLIRTMSQSLQSFRNRVEQTGVISGDVQLFTVPLVVFDVEGIRYSNLVSPGVNAFAGQEERWSRDSAAGKEMATALQSLPRGVDLYRIAPRLLQIFLETHFRTRWEVVWGRRDHENFWPIHFSCRGSGDGPVDTLICSTRMPKF